MIIGNPIMAGASGPAASIFVTGLSQTDTVTATNGSKTLTGKWTQKPNPAFHGLPDGYTELESIEGTGTQYIQLPFTYNQIDTVKAKFEITDISYTSHTALVNCEGANNLKAFIQWFPINDGGYSKGWWDSYCSSYNTHPPEPVANLIYEAESVLKSGEQKLILNGVTSYSLTRTGTPNCPYPVRVMRAGNFETNTNCSKVKLYSISMFLENNEVCNLIPCKRNSDSTIGLYDLVSNTFFGNSGTGIFVAGAEIPQTIDGFLIKPIRDLGTWTVTATDGTNTTTQDVLVDVITEYEIEMSYKLWLYKDGDECEGITGSWIDGGYNGTSTGGITKNSDCLTLKHPVNGAQQARTINKIDLTKYTTVFAEVITSTDNYSSALIRIQSGESYSDNSEVTPGDTSKVTTKTVFQTDISSLEGSYYVKPTLYWGSYANFYRIWLE